MKKFKKILLALIAVILLAGCGLKESVNLKVTSDKKVEFGYKVLMDNELIDSILSMSDESVSLDDETGDKKEYTDEERWEYLETENCDTENEGYTCEKVEEGTFKGFYIKKSFDSIDEVTGTGDKINIIEMDGLDKPVFFKKDGETYSSNFEYVVEEDNELSNYSNQMDLFVINFEVILPNKSVSNNADTVSDDGLTLTWDLSKATNKSIDFTFKFDGKSTTNTTTNSNNSNNTNNNLINQNTNSSDELVSTKSNTGKYILIGVIGGVVLLIIIILIIVFAASASKKKNLNVETESSKMFSTPINTSKQTASNAQAPQEIDPVSEAPVQSETPTETASITPETEAPVEENNNEEKQN